MLGDSNVNLVEVSLRCCDVATTVLKSRIQPFGCKSFPITNLTTGSRHPDGQPTCILDQTLDCLFARPASVKTSFLADESQVVFQENTDIVVDNRWRYIVRKESQCSVSGIWWKPCRIGTSGLLVKKTRSRTAFNIWASAESYRIIRILLSSLHLVRSNQGRWKETEERGCK